MKNGRSLEQVAAELARQRDAKRDFLADTRNLQVDVVPSKTKEQPASIVTRMVGKAGNQEQFGMRLHALRQMEDHLGIPAKFADHLQTKHPDILAHNINELLHRQPSTQMVRTLDGNVRAFLSNSYRVMDNYNFAEAIMSAVEEFKGNITVESCEVTEARLHIKVVRNDLVQRIGWKEGFQMGSGHNLFDEVVAAASFSNSEVGSGGLSFLPGVYTKRCTNLAVFENQSVRKVHLGSKSSAGDNGFWEVLSDKTRELSDEALWAQIRDLTKAALDGRLFGRAVELLDGAAKDAISGDITDTVEIVGKRFDLNEGERKGILDHLIRGGQMTRYGLHSAITRYSQDVESYDRASELERLGGRIIELAPKDWQALAA